MSLVDRGLAWHQGLHEQRAETSSSCCKWAELCCSVEEKVVLVWGALFQGHGMQGGMDASRRKQTITCGRFHLTAPLILVIALLPSFQLFWLSWLS